MEGEGRFEFGRESEISHESEEVLKHPEQVFDSSVEQSQRESEEVMGRINKGEIDRSIEGIEFKTVGNKIQIVWPINSATATALVLNPITEGKGLEGAVLSYTGAYGQAQRKGSEWQLTDKVSLEKLFGAPEDVTFIVRPTIDRFAVGQDLLNQAMFGDNARVLYLGLGFLLLGQEWMHVGMHEAGHLPDFADENTAWTRANQEYAKRNRPNKESVVAGKSSGLFGILKRPAWYDKSPTIGDLMKYGLVSHAQAGNAVLPKQWERKSESIMRKFNGVIERAHDRYNHLLR